MNSQQTDNSNQLRGGSGYVFPGYPAIPPYDKIFPSPSPSPFPPAPEPYRCPHCGACPCCGHKKAPIYYEVTCQIH